MARKHGGAMDANGIPNLWNPAPCRANVRTCDFLAQRQHESARPRSLTPVFGAAARSGRKQVEHLLAALASSEGGGSGANPRGKVFDMAAVMLDDRGHAVGAGCGC